MNYQRLKDTTKRAAGDYMSLLDGLKLSAKDRDLARAREAAAQFFSTPTGRISAVAVPALGTAAGIGLIDAAQEDISPMQATLALQAGVPYAAGTAIASSMAAPFVGRALDRFDGSRLALSEAERRTLLADLAQLDAEVAAGNNLQAAYEEALRTGTASDNMRPQISRDDLASKAQSAKALRSGKAAQVEAQYNALQNRARSRGGGLTAAGLGLLGLAAAVTNDAPSAVAAAAPARDPFLEPVGWSAINATERMKNWAAGRPDDYEFALPY